MITDAGIGLVGMDTERVATTAPHFEVRVLGPLAVSCDGVPVDLRGKSALLVALLVARAGDAVSVESLIDGLWGDDPPATARKGVQVNVSRARRELGDEFPLATIRNGYSVAGDGFNVDANSFVSAVDTAAGLLDTSPESAANMLTDALGLWRGSPYTGFEDSETLRGEIMRLNAQRIRAKRLLYQARLQLGDHVALLGELDAATTEHPYDEEFRRLHMLALYRSGRQTEALRAYECTRKLLVNSGLQPTQELQQTYDDVLHHRPSLHATPDPPRPPEHASNLVQSQSRLAGRQVRVTHVGEAFDVSHARPIGSAVRT